MSDTTPCQARADIARKITFAPTCGMFAGRQGRNSETHTWWAAHGLDEDALEAAAEDAVPGPRWW